MGRADRHPLRFCPFFGPENIDYSDAMQAMLSVL